MVTKTCDVLERRQTIPDHRRQCQNLKHRLADILLLGFCGTLAGCDDFVELADGATDNADFFRTFLELPNGIPSHDTCNRTFTTVKPATLQAVLLPWFLERRGLPGDWVPVDGQTMRHTRRNSKNLGALHVVSAWAGQTGLTRGPVAVAAQSHAITAIPQLLELLDLRQKIVTLAARGCQKEIAQTLVNQEGDYLLSAKDNQPTLAAEAQTAVATASLRTSPHRTFTTEDKDQGRHEQRTVRVLPAAKPLSAALLSAWPALLTLVMVVRVVTCQATGVTTSETSYFISSLRPNARRIGAAIRGHWSIENSLHGVLAVVFREDARRL